MPGKFDLKDYVTVAQRLQAFKLEYPNGAINTTLLSAPGDKVVVFRAEAYRNMTDAKPAGTGHAHEIEGQGMVNQTSAMENCETSAVGRALAMMGYEVQNGVASREEMAGAMQREQRPAPAPQAAPPAAPQAAPQSTAPTGNFATEKQRKYMFKLAEERDLDITTLGEYVTRTYGVVKSSELTKRQMSELIDGITTGRVGAELAMMVAQDMGTEVADEGATA